MDLKNKYIALKRELFDKYYDNLNEKQRQAVYSVNGPLLILAGAGSGKTTVLVNRLAYILRYGNAYYSENVPPFVNENLLKQMELAKALPKETLAAFLSSFREVNAAPWNVMAITFTNKAAREIKERLCTVFANEDINADDIWSGTFHSICMRFLRRWAELIGYSKDFGISDTGDTKKLMTECLKDLNINTTQYPVKRIITAISHEKDRLNTPEDTLESAGGDAFYKVVAKVYALYQQRLVSSSLMDFDDIIMQTVRLFKENPDILSEVQRRFKYISVDEYQDTNKAQFVLVSQLAGGYKNIMAVGDDDQSIYKFRGATIENILNFDKVYPEAVTIKLEQNYRSTKTILEAANAVIGNNRERKGKNLWTAGETGDLISVSRVGTQNDEARFISDKVTALLSQGKAQYKDIAVLYRTNVQSRTIEQAFAKSAIPYRMLGSLRFFDRQEIKDILSYLAVVNNPKDSVRLKRIINIPKRGIGDRSIDAAHIIAESEGISLLEVLEKAQSYTAIPSSAAKKMEELFKFFQDLSKEELSVSALIEKIIAESGYMGMLLKMGKEEADRIENLGELVSTAKQYEEASDEPSLSGFLEEVALVSDVDKYDESANAVVLMTIHSAKGLEFPVVFLPGMEEGLFPGFQSIMNPGEIEEERRLAYVALTRAKQKIYITCTYNRMINGSTQYNPPSRFIDEIPSNLCASDIGERQKKVYTFGDEGVSQRNSYSSYGASSYGSGRMGVFGQGKTALKGSGTTAAKASASVEVFSVGDSVRHSTFGVGTVVSAKPMGGDTLYEINFEKVGTKKLMATYARLTKA